MINAQFVRSSVAAGLPSVLDQAAIWLEVGSELACRAGSRGLARSVRYDGMHCTGSKGLPFPPPLTGWFFLCRATHFRTELSPVGLVQLVTRLLSCADATMPNHRGPQAPAVLRRRLDREPP